MIGIVSLILGVISAMAQIEWGWITCLCTGISSAIAFFVCVLIAMIAQIPKENNYQKAIYEREILVYRLKHKEENIVGNEMLYSEIIDFNNELRTIKRYSNNLWVGLFFNDKIATIEYIEIDKK